MSGTVRGDRIREDAYRRVGETIDDQKEHSLALEEQAKALRKLNVVEPFIRARTTTAKTLEEFYDMFRKILEVAAEYDEKAYPIKFSKSFPTQDSEFPCFTVRLRRRSPWRGGGTAAEISPREVESEDDLEYPGDILTTSIRRQENIVELTISARDGETVDELADWVENKFFEYLWALQWGGLAHPVVWQGRESDITSIERSNRIYSTSLVFQVVTATITHVRETPLRKISLVLGLNSDEIP